MKTLLPLFWVILCLISCSGEADKISDQENIQIEVKTNIINPRFGGIGFHVFYHLHDAPRWHYQQVFAKRWRELNPSFARITDKPEWNKEDMDRVASYLEVMKDTDTELYFTTWGTRAIENYDQEIDYVRKLTDNLQYLKQDKGFSNLKYFCMTNELTLEKWASLVNNLDYFKRIQGLFYEEINSRDLDIGLLATDASPIRNWNTIQWAADNMDDITAVYGGHHYINSYHLSDLSFYPFFLEKMKWGTAISRNKNKDFIIGEFGPKQNSNILDSVKHDASIYNNTPREPYAGIQISEAIIAMINGGVYASSYWTFSDFPSSYRTNYINKWGVFKWEIDNHSTRPNYYALGLLTKFMRGPAEVFQTHSKDSLLRIAAIRNTETNSISIAVVNRNSRSQPVNVTLDEIPSKSIFRKYVYNPASPPFNHFGDLQSFSKLLTIDSGIMTDTIPAESLVVYTTGYDAQAPAPVKGLMVDGEKIERRNVLSWASNDEDDFCYYRIYRSEKEDFKISNRTQIASTISNEYIDMTVHGLPQFYYKVLAVDQSGNVSN